MSLRVEPSSVARACVMYEGALTPLSHCDGNKMAAYVIDLIILVQSRSIMHLEECMRRITCGTDLSPLVLTLHLHWERQRLFWLIALDNPYK